MRRLACVYLLLWIALAIKPWYPKHWALENIVVVVGWIVLAVSWRWYVFSRTSYLLMAIFLALHGIGAHYTYSEVPVSEWFGAFSSKLGSVFERNHYDRVVHFAYGLLLLYPFREAFLHAATVRATFWTFLVPISFVLATSLLYELIEWAAAIVLGGEAGNAFLGSQGDIWDAQQDSFCALTGALIASSVIALRNWRIHRDPAGEWARQQDFLDWRKPTSSLNPGD